MVTRPGVDFHRRGGGERRKALDSTSCSLNVTGQDVLKDLKSLSIVRHNTVTHRQTKGRTLFLTTPKERRLLPKTTEFCTWDESWICRGQLVYGKQKEGELCLVGMDQ